MTDVEKEIVLSIFSRFERDDYIVEAFSASKAVQAYERLPLMTAVHEMAWNMIQRTEFTLQMENGRGWGNEGKLS